MFALQKISTFVDTLEEADVFAKNILYYPTVDR